MPLEYLEKAIRFLSIAEHCLTDHKDYETCASRCYYAAFHGCIAMFKSIGKDQAEWKHSFILGNFSLEFSRRRKLFPQKFGHYLNDLYAIRKEADYKPYQTSKSDASKALKMATEILSSIQKEVGKNVPG